MRRWVLVWILHLIPLVPLAPAQSVSYTGSAQYTSGAYIFSERTHSVYVSNGLTFSTDRVDLSISVPVIFQNSPWVSYSLVGGIPSGGPQQGAVGGGKGDGQGPKSLSRGPENGDRKGRQPGETIVLPDTASYTDVGIGDPSARLDVQLVKDATAGFGMAVRARAKTPLADVDRGFGTGAWDGGLGLSLSKRHGSWFLFGDAMYWWLGDMTEVVLNNSVAYSVSLGRSLRSGKVGLLASLSGYTSEIIDNVDPPLQAGLGVNYGWAQGKYSLSGSLVFGLSESTSDVTGGVGWQVGF